MALVRDGNSLIAALIAAALLASPAAAHTMGASYSTLSLQAGTLTATLKLQAHDVLEILGAPVTADAASEIPQRSREIVLYASNRYRVEIDGKPLEPVKVRSSFGNEGAGWALVHFVFRPVTGTSSLSLRSMLMLEANPAHVHMAALSRGGGRTEELVLKAGQPSRFTLGPGSAAIWPQVRQYLGLGVEHIFLGYDHILFLFALLLLASSFFDLVKIVSSFTVAHTVTLILATLEVVSLPARLVETAIAVSIVYVALENFFVRDVSKRWRLTFAFGLVHGFGFSSVLRELGLPATGLIQCLLSFNVGVELGQLAIVAMIFPLLRKLACWQEYDRVVLRGGSGLVLAIGLNWFFERAFAP